MKSFQSTIIMTILGLILIGSVAKGQVVASIDGTEIKSDELLYAFNKNRKKDAPIRLDSLETYLEQYINFKLKVRAARKMGLDTSKAFQDELQGYLSQIKKPYLENPQSEEALIRETYNRMKADINASHILIKVAPTAPPQDTLKAYQFLDSLRMTIDSKQEFEEMARKFSQDGSAQVGGNLGWFTAMHMVTPFEDGAYNTAVGRVSEVVRSTFGYHLIYVNDKRENKGKIKTSHIFFTNQRGSNAARLRALEIYDSLENGSKWSEMARKYSDDQGTRQDAGRLPWAGLKQLPDDFLEIAYSIDSIGKYSKPRETQFGWHIVKLDDVQPLEPYQIKKEEISMLLKRMGRNTLQEEIVLKKLKEENSFSQNPEELNAIIEAISGSKKDVLLQQEIAKKPLFSHGGKTARVSSFLNDLPGFSISYSKSQLMEFYEKFEREFIFNFEDSIAPVKYPEYGYLMKEYEEGLLLFEVMQRRVWEKAVNDSLGLDAYYKNHLKDYMVGERINCLLVNSLNKELLEGVSKVDIPKDSLMDAESILARKVGKEKMNELKIAKRNLLASEFSNFESIKTSQGNWFQTNDGKSQCLNMGYLKEGPQAFEEIKGIVMANYQEELDQVWIKDLRDASKIKVFKKELKALSTN